MESIFLEVVMFSCDLQEADFQGRDEIEDPLSKALINSGYGEVTGGGSGSGKSIIDVEINSDCSFEEALSFIKDALTGLNVPKSTVIKRHHPKEEVFDVYK